MAAMTDFTLTAPLTAPGTAWDEVRAHPELVWGHGAPDLEPGRDYDANNALGIGGQGRIETVEPGRVEFSWAGDGWQQPGRFLLFIGTDLVIEARAVPDEQAPAARDYWQRAVATASGYLNQPDPAGTAPRAVLFDADGVLQSSRPGWLAEFTRIGGPTFVADAFAAELDCLTGDADLKPRLERLLACGTGGSVDEILQVWHDLVVDPDAVAVVDRVRTAGLLAVLATNQQSYRGARMRHYHEMDRHFDHVFYSYEVGVAKPSAEYFQHILDVLELPADQVVFVDDSPSNVRAARAAGIPSALHRTSDGAAGLASELAALGVPI